MAGITGLGDTYNLPNFVGDLFGVTPEDTPFLSSIGGLTGGKSANGNVEFTWQSYDLRDPATNRQRAEGADAPTAEERVRFNGDNILEIHQEAVSVSYTKQAASNKVSATTIQGSNPVQDELGWQLTQSFKQIARDIEKTFITGTYHRPTASSGDGVRQTRGLIEAITDGINSKSNEVTVAALDDEAVLDLMQEVWENGGIQETETRTLMVNASLKRALTAAFVTDKNYQEQTRDVGGVHVQTIETDFGRCNIMLNRHMPADKLVVVSLEECAPVFLEIPGKGHFFAEPLAKTGAQEKVQVYGEIGLEYGNPLKHGVLTVTSAS